MLSANDPIHSMTIKYRYNGAVRELTARHVDLISRNPHIPRICTHNTPPLRGPAPPQITYHVQPGSQENWQINFLLIDTRTVYCCTRIYPEASIANCSIDLPLEVVHYRYRLLLLLLYIRSPDVLPPEVVLFIKKNHNDQEN